MRYGTFALALLWSVQSFAATQPPDEGDESIRAALDLLLEDERPPVPVVWINPRTASPSLARLADRACAFVLGPRPVVVFVSRSCQTLHWTPDKVFTRAILASILAHEGAHIRGSDERGAQQVERATILRLTREWLPPDRWPTVLRYLAQLSRRHHS